MSSFFLTTCFRRTEKALFTTHRLLIDLSYLPGLDFDFERDGWVSTGPGSKSGLELIFNCREKDTDLHLEAMTFIKTEQAKYWADSGKTPPTLLGNGRPIGLVEIEHALCEFSKYSNVTKAQLDSKAKRVRSGFSLACVWRYPGPDHRLFSRRTGRSGLLMGAQ